MELLDRRLATAWIDLAPGVGPDEDGIFDLLDIDLLDDEKRRELAGNQLSPDLEIQDHYLAKAAWSSYGSTLAGRKLDVVADILAGHHRAVAFLGCGHGFEIGQLLDRGIRTDLVLASDLSRLSLAAVPRALAEHPGRLVVFTSDLDDVPLRRWDLPVVVFEALHHTPDMHATIDALLTRRPTLLVFVEPTTNAVIRGAARRGWAQRTEYSGVKPGRLDLGWLTSAAEHHGYELEVTTFWELPEDYARRLAGDSELAERTLLAALRLLSLAGRPFRFGNSSVCALSRPAPAR